MSCEIMSEDLLVKTDDISWFITFSRTAILSQKDMGTGITQFLLDKFLLTITHLPSILQVLTVHLIYLFQLFGVFLKTFKLC